MKSIADFARKPELIQIVLDHPEIVEEFGEPVIFYMKDYVDINTYFDFFKYQSDNDNGLNQVLQKIILKEDGSPVLGTEDTLPIRLAVGALSKINENLGKLKTKPSMSETGILQS
jgi:hypothetical protein